MDHPFKTDGCSGVFSLDTGMKIACLYHDWDYYVGGDSLDRLMADVRFAVRIWIMSRYWWLTPVRYCGVRIFGTSTLSWTGVSWGYGWKNFKPRPREEGGYAEWEQRHELTVQAKSIAGADWSRYRLLIARTA